MTSSWFMPFVRHISRSVIPCFTIFGIFLNLLSLVVILFSISIYCMTLPTNTKNLIYIYSFCNCWAKAGVPLTHKFQIHPLCNLSKHISNLTKIGAAAKALGESASTWLRTWINKRDCSELGTLKKHGLNIIAVSERGATDLLLVCYTL